MKALDLIRPHDFLAVEVKEVQSQTSSRRIDIYYSERNKDHFLEDRKTERLAMDGLTPYIILWEGLNYFHGILRRQSWSEGRMFSKRIYKAVSIKTKKQ